MEVADRRISMVWRQSGPDRQEKLALFQYRLQRLEMEGTYDSLRKLSQDIERGQCVDRGEQYRYIKGK